MRTSFVAIILIGASAAPASAVDVTFSGTINSACTLAVPTPGSLGISATGDLTSDPLGAATVTILSIGSNEVTVDPPQWLSKPGDYDATGQELSVAYAGVGGLSAVNQDYTSTQTSFPVSTLPLTALAMNVRAVNPNGFVAGDYVMKVPVTCSLATP